MVEAKLQFKLGAIEFSGEGDEGWLADQLEKILEQAPKLANIVPQQTAPPLASPQPPSHTPMEPDATIAQQPLASFLREKNTSKNQTQKFLATAVWLEAKGRNRLTTGDVSRALKESNQTRLSNTSDCLKRNITKGYCERDGKEFFVTVEGKDSL